VRLRSISPERRRWLPWRRLPFSSTRDAPAIVAEIVERIEGWLLWSRFGL
jgi:hypothetical protein